MSKNCDRCGVEITAPFHYIPRNGSYYFCSDECLLADYGVATHELCDGVKCEKEYPHCVCSDADNDWEIGSLDNMGGY